MPRQVPEPGPFALRGPTAASIGTRILRAERIGILPLVVQPSRIRLPLRRSGRRAVGIAFLNDRLLLRASDGRWVRIRLPADSVRASPTEATLASPAEVARSVLAGLAALGSDSRPFSDAVIALPDGAVRAALGEGTGSAAVRRLRIGLISGLRARREPAASKHSASDFRFGTLVAGPLRKRSILGAVSGNRVVRQYESVAEAAGLTVRWVDAASLAVLPAWLGQTRRSRNRRRHREGRTRVLLLLHRSHFVLAAARGGRLIGFRMKLRAAGDPRPPILALRLLGEQPASVAVRGVGAGPFAEALAAEGGFPDEVNDTAEGNEAPLDSGIEHLALGALLRRAGASPALLAPASAEQAESSG